MAKKTVNQEMKIKTRKISDLIRAEYNPRELTKEQQNQLTDSLKRFGLVDPIIVNTPQGPKEYFSRWTPKNESLGINGE